MKKIIFASIISLLTVLMFCSCNSRDSTQTAVDEIVKYCNEERKNAGMPELILDNDLCEAAEIRAGEITTQDSFAHVRPDGSGCFTVLHTDYIYAGENLAKGKPDGKAIVEAWMNSEAHRKNVLTSEFNKIGIACTEADGVYYWAALFTD